jgi:23S rRNA (guanosine2251-2'-O)-methyltransferase
VNNPGEPDGRSPKDRFITVYGRKPVLAALVDPGLTVDKVLVAHGSHGDTISAITEAAALRAVPVREVTAQRVKVLAGNGRHDQGVLADVVAPRMRMLPDYLAAVPRSSTLLLLDGITNPANVGMILRTATAAGMDGILLPRRGVPGVDPLVIKASAGIAFTAPILRCGTAAEAADQVRAAGFAVYGLSADAPGSVFQTVLPERAVFVLGGETEGISAAVRTSVTGWVGIPMANGVESLNVASAAAVLCFDLVRRRAEVLSTPAASAGHRAGRDPARARSGRQQQPQRRRGGDGRGRHVARGERGDPGNGPYRRDRPG